MLTVAIIGAGPLGRQVALAAARAGMSVRLEDVMPATLHHAQEYIRQQLSQVVLGRDASSIEFVSTIEDAVRDADLVIDWVPDELESKLEILWLLDRMSPPRTVIATPTTNLSITDLAGCTYRPDRCVAIVAGGSDFAQGLTGQVVIRTTAQTSTQTVATAGEFWRKLGVTPLIEIEEPKPLPVSPADSASHWIPPRTDS